MKLINGTKCWVPDQEKTAWLDKLTVENDFPAYQFDRVQAMLKHTPGRRVAIDGGAHVGLIAHQLQLHFQHVIAVEPIDELAECLRMNTPRGRVTVVQAALSDLSSRQVILDGSPRKSVSWTVVGMQPRTEEAPINTRCARTTTIDLVAAASPRVDLIKLDLEGMEALALIGGSKVIERDRPTILIEEKHDHAAKASAWLEFRGYRQVWKSKHDRLFTHAG